MNLQLWHYTDLATGEGKFIQAGSQRSASDKLKARGIRFSGLKKYKARLKPLG